MEFYNAKLLPKGLHEIIVAFTPYNIYPDTKIIAISRKIRRGLLGSVGTDSITNSYHLRLYPTTIAFYARGKGTLSFCLWMSYLKTVLHEIGHLATYHQWENLYRGDGRGSSTRKHKVDYYIEKVADGWRDRALAKILEVSSRFGQPPGALTGYPGILAAKMRNSGRPWTKTENLWQHRVDEWRALGCDAQVPLSDVISSLFYNDKYFQYISPSLHLTNYEHLLNRLRNRLRRVIHSAAKELRIGRFFTNRNGCRYLMFNAGEAEAVYRRLADYNPDALLGGLWHIVQQVRDLADPDFGAKQSQWTDEAWELFDDNLLRTTVRNERGSVSAEDDDIQL